MSSERRGRSAEPIDGAKSHPPQTKLRSHIRDTEVTANTVAVNVKAASVSYVDVALTTNTASVPILELFAQTKRSPSVPPAPGQCAEAGNDFWTPPRVASVRRLVPKDGTADHHLPAGGAPRPPEPRRDPELSTRVLAAYDRLARAIEPGEPFVSAPNPSPGHGLRHPVRL
jgi:hypothetical protein